MILSSFRWTSCVRAVLAVAVVVAIGTAQVASATTGFFDSAATETGVVSTGAPGVSLGARSFDADTWSLLMNNGNDIATNGPCMSGDPPAACTYEYAYSTPAQASAAQEYMIFKFDDFAGVDAGANVVGTGSMTWATRYTHSTETVPQEDLGEFKVYEITAGDANWESNIFSDGTTSPGAVTYTTLLGTFAELTGITEIVPLVADGDHYDGVAADLIPGKLVSNGGWASYQKITGIPAATIERLMDGSSVGLAFGGVGSTNFSIHSQSTFLANKGIALSFDWDTDASTPLAGDANGDGTVDLLDLDVLGTNFGVTPATFAQGDFNGDNVVDLLDLDILGTNFGATGSVAIPEPTAALLLFVGLTGLVARRK